MESLLSNLWGLKSKKIDINPSKPFPSISDANFRHIVEKSDHIVLVISPLGRIIYASPSFIKQYAWKYEEIIGLEGFRYIHPQDLPKATKLLKELIKYPRKTIRSELKVFHKNGSLHWVTISATNLLKNKHIKGIVINFHDVTKLKMIQDKRDEFIGVASHELKTPVTTLKAYVQIMLKEQASIVNPKLVDYLEKMELQINRLTKLVNELLNVSRIEEENLVLNKENLNIGELVEDVVAQMRQTSGNHKIIIKKNLQKNLMADRDKISEVLINLISNAVKYSPEDTDIIVSCKHVDNRIDVSVKDFGPGIPKNKQAKIFDRFYRSFNSGGHEGLGLGLFISSKFIAIHKGAIWVKSTEGKGSTFSFSLPLGKHV